MKLELKQIKGYLGTGLKIENSIGKIIELTTMDLSYHIEKGFKPILRPLSDLTKEITVNGETFIPLDLLQSLAYPIDYFEDSSLTEDYILSWINSNSKDHHVHFIPHGLINQLLEWHFNIYNLSSELWVDINTIK